MMMMMLEQAALSSSTSLRLIIPQNPNSKPINQFSTVLRNQKQPQKHCLKLKLKCSSSSSYSSMETEKVVVVEAYPKPTEIQWNKELCNSVNFIGIVASPVEIRHFPSGKVVAWTHLSFKKNATQSCWINLTFWNELAHIAYQHLQTGHHIFVSGRLTTDAVETDGGKYQTYYKVVCQQLNFIESFSSAYSRDQDSDNLMPANSELWNAFFANPGEWWDNRKNKKNPKGPDFKHKDTGEALWIEGRSNPPWVKSQLAILESRMGPQAGHNTRMPVDMMTPDETLYF
ncbi:hypothetical protein RIF29_26251 [Crotalaria pallida]|uniref:Uncharacterized protein n=1 Tax=Crotalaria pallida TaxID=3830 RepID=A0AAN9I1K7_CROPI